MTTFVFFFIATALVGVCLGWTASYTVRHGRDGFLGQAAIFILILLFIILLTLTSGALQQ